MTTNGALVPLSRPNGSQVVPPRPLPLLWGTVASFGFLLAGYMLMLLAPNIGLVLLSTFVRSIGQSELALLPPLPLPLPVQNVGLDCCGLGLLSWRLLARAS